jgi:agmatine deiminase
MKADFEKHKCTILLYPERRDVWRKGARLIRETVERLAETIVRFEPVFWGYSGKNIPKLAPSSRLKMFDIEYDDIWTRDTGGVPVGDDELVSFGFDAWGGLYGSVAKDLTVAETIAQLHGLGLKKSSLITERGKGKRAIKDKKIISENDKKIISIKK